MALADSFVKKQFDRSYELEEQRKAALLEAMGLEDHDVEKLRKMQLSGEEAVIAKREELDRIRGFKGRKEDWEEFVDAKRRMGRVLHHSEFFRKLKTIVPTLIVAPGAQENRVGMYVVRCVPVNEVEGYVGTAGYLDVPIYIGYMELGESPEYEIDLVNDVNIAIAQRRGWRTILLRMIARRYKCDQCKQGERPNPRIGCGKNGCGNATSLVSEDAVESVFGFPTNGATASNYRKQLWEFRNGLR